MYMILKLLYHKIVFLNKPFFSNTYYTYKNVAGYTYFFNLLYKIIQDNVTELTIRKYLHIYLYLLFGFNNLIIFKNK